MEKNTNAINKIIAELSLSDYKSQWNRLTDKQKYNVHIVTGKQIGRAHV